MMAVQKLKTSPLASSHTELTDTQPYIPEIRCPLKRGFSWWLRGKDSTYLTGDLDSFPELGGTPGDGNGSPLQHSWRIPWTEEPGGELCSLMDKASLLSDYLTPSWNHCSVSQSCPTLCDPMDCSIPGFPVLHYLLQFSQTHVHWVSDAIQPFHPLSAPSPPALKLSQHLGLFQWVGSSHEVAKVLELQHHSFQWIFSVDLL